MLDETLLIDQTIKKIEVFFRYGGFNIRSTEITSSNTIKARMIYIFNCFWLNIDVFGAIYWFIEGVRTGKDFLNLTHAAPCISFSSLASIRSVLFMMNEKHIHKLIQIMRNLEKNEKKREQSNEKIQIINKEKDFLDLVLNVIKWLFAIVATAFALCPLAIMWVKYYNTREVELILPFFVLYPFDSYQYKIWPFAYFHQVWSEFIVVCNFCSADLFLFTCCTYIRVQFKLLQHRIDNIIPAQKDVKRMFIDNDEFQTKFKDLIKWHQDLIVCTQILETIYSKSMLLNFMFSSMIICLTGFNVTVVNDVAIVVSFFCFLFMSLIQIFFLCFFADLLMTASMEITDAVYKSQWYMADSSIGKQLLIMQIRALKPCKLTAFGFADVNLNSFMRVLSTAWSYFALLQTIYTD